MAYSNPTEALKEMLRGYSEEENTLIELYGNAIKLNEQAKTDKLKALDASYRADRNDAYSDSMRDGRNTQLALSSRGLGFSGEAAQARLNSDMALSNRLGDLALENAKNKSDVINESDKYLLDLKLEEADKRADLSKRKNSVIADMTKIINDSAPNNQSGKNDGNTTVNTTVNGGGNGNRVEEEESSPFFTPETKPKDLARLAVQNATGDNYIKSEYDAHLVNKYLLELQENYNLSEEYMKELIFMLKAYGYEELEPKELKLRVITKEATEMLDDCYQDRYRQYTDSGMPGVSARRYAMSAAVNDVLEMIYKNTENRAEFLKFCKAAQISDKKALSYAADKVWYDPESARPNKTATEKHINGSALLK